jgi:hypothetical protein
MTKMASELDRREKANPIQQMAASAMDAQPPGVPTSAPGKSNSMT